MIISSLYTLVSLDTLISLFKPIVEYELKLYSMLEEYSDRNKEMIQLVEYIQNFRDKRCLTCIEANLFCKISNQMQLLNIVYNRRINKNSIPVNKDIVSYIVLPYINNTISLQCINKEDTNFVDKICIYNTISFQEPKLEFNSFLHELYKKEKEFHEVFYKNELESEICIDITPYGKKYYF
jgi:hypothetical protein